MALKAFCTTCQRTVYIEEGDTPVCPVCSSPLIQTTTSADENDDAAVGEPDPAVVDDETRQ